MLSSLKIAITAGKYLGDLGQGCSMYCFGLVNNSTKECFYYRIFAVNIEFALETLKEVYSGRDLRWQIEDVNTVRLSTPYHRGYSLFLFC